jgi:hypothetical protein
MIEVELTDRQAETIFEHAKNKVCDWEYHAANHKDEIPSLGYYAQMEMEGCLKEAEKWKAIANAISEAKFGKKVYDDVEEKV